MNTGEFSRTYTNNEISYVVRGFSNKSNEYVYPNETWSWTSWTPRITDTYKSFRAAKLAVSGGYLKDMIETQQIVDIEIFEIIKVTECVENKKVRSYPLSAIAPERIPRPFAEEEYVIIDDGKVYGQISEIIDDRVYIRVTNGCWVLVLDMSGDIPVIHPESEGGPAGRPIQISFVGVPDPTMAADDYTSQIGFYKENLANQIN